MWILVTLLRWLRFCRPIQCTTLPPLQGLGRVRCTPPYPCKRGGFFHSLKPWPSGCNGEILLLRQVLTSGWGFCGRKVKKKSKSRKGIYLVKIHLWHDLLLMKQWSKSKLKETWASHWGSLDYCLMIACLIYFWLHLRPVSEEKFAANTYKYRNTFIFITCWKDTVIFAL